ncbi:hypothetical protein HDU80_000242 [Chytriomyces hyalinus]|nr:hypothetical protein HDU80_000242 [Chytriomyces hyalinus]
MALKLKSELDAKLWGKDHDIAVYDWLLENELPTGKHLLADTPELKSWSSSTLNSKMKTIRKQMEKKDWHPSNDKAPMRLAAMVKKWNKEEERDNPLFGPDYVPKPPIYPPRYLVSPLKPTLSPDSNYTKDGVRASQVESTIRLHEIMSTCKIISNSRQLLYMIRPKYVDAGAYEPTAAFFNYFHTDAGAEEFRYLINLLDAVDFNPTESQFVSTA